MLTFQKPESKIRWWSFSLLMALSLTSFGQSDTLNNKGIKSIADLIKQGNWGASNRNFFMTTINQAGLKDDYALATGVGLSFNSANYNGFEFGMSSFGVFKLASSSINEPEGMTGQSNRYEMGLFDVENTSNFKNLYRLEKLYVRYNWLRGNSVTVGRMDMNNPFINPQHGRMRPTMPKGIWGEFFSERKFKLNAGFIYGIMPRSTVQWHSISESIGIYSQGVTTKGVKSNYAGNLNSLGLGVIQAEMNFSKNAKITLWNGYLDNIMNTAILEGELFKAKKKDLIPVIKFAFYHQNALRDGGNADQNLTYIDKGAQSNALSFRLDEMKLSKKLKLQVNYTIITKDGRYLMPREFGRDWFYTFQTRERNEGLGGVQAGSVRLYYKTEKGLNSNISYGYYKLPDVKNYRLNKYGLPSYHQANWELQYQFKGVLDRFTITSLVAAKFNAGETYGNLKYVYNKVNMMNYNLIVDFKL